MTGSTTISPKMLPAKLALWLKAINFKGRKVRLRVVADDSMVAITGNYWDGGSISNYDSVCYKTGSSMTIRGPRPFDGGGAVNEYRPNGSIVVIETGFFCGEKATPTVVCTVTQFREWVGYDALLARMGVVEMPHMVFIDAIEDTVREDELPALWAAFRELAGFPLPKPEKTRR